MGRLGVWTCFRIMCTSMWACVLKLTRLFPFPSPRWPVSTLLLYMSITLYTWASYLRTLSKYQCIPKLKMASMCIKLLWAWTLWSMWHALFYERYACPSVGSFHLDLLPLWLACEYQCQVFFSVSGNKEKACVVLWLYVLVWQWSFISCFCFRVKCFDAN